MILVTLLGASEVFLPYVANATLDIRIYDNPTTVPATVSSWNFAMSSTKGGCMGRRTDQELAWDVLDSQTAYEHPYFFMKSDHVRLPNGHETDYTVWVNGDVGQVLALTEDDHLLLVRQYKHGAQQVILECPGGFINSEESPEVAAHRELREETGYVAGVLELLGKFRHHPSKETGLTYFYLARDVVLSQAGPEPDKTEQIEVVRLTWQQALSMIVSGEIQQTGTIAGILLAAQKLGKKE